MKNFFIVALILIGLAVVANPAADTAAAVTVPTVAVLPFEARERTAANEDTGKSVAELLSIALQESGGAELVERAELDQALDELQLSAAGLTEKSSQLKLGRLIGAKILITGSMFRSGEQNYLVAKVIGTETSRVLGASINGSGAFIDMVPELAEKLAVVLEQQSAKLLPVPVTEEAVAVDLAAQVKGNGRKVFVGVTEDISVEGPDPAAETELKKLLLALGFEVVPTRENADFIVLGEAIAAHAGQYRKFTSASARVELSITTQAKKVLATGAAQETLAGVTYRIAAKDAIVQATLRLSRELFGVLQ